MSRSTPPSPDLLPPPHPRPAHGPGHSRALRGLRFALHRVQEQQLLTVAASLTFTTVLAIVPMLAVVLSLFTAFPLFQEFRLALEDFLTHSLLPPNVSDNIMEYLNQFAMQASRLTTIGGAFLVVTSLLLIMTIDQTLNDIWRVTRQRPLPQRALVYWAVLTLGPVVTGASLWTTSYLTRESMGLVGDISGPLGWGISLVPLLVTGIAFTGLFVVVPNRRVLWRDALIGGFGAALVLEVMKFGFAFYLTSFPTYTVIYGAFATVPIFLLWIYLSWFVVLFGAVTAASLPLARIGRWEVNREAGAEFIDAVAVLQLLHGALNGYPSHRSTNFIAGHLRLHYGELSNVLEKLAEMGLVAHTEDNHWLLACNPDTTSLEPLVDRFLLDRAHPRLQENIEPLVLVNAVFSHPDERITLSRLSEITAGNDDDNDDGPHTDPSPSTSPSPLPDDVSGPRASSGEHHAKSQ